MEPVQIIQILIGQQILFWSLMGDAKIGWEKIAVNIASLVNWSMSIQIAQAAASNIFGRVSPPAGVAGYNAGSGGQIGLLFFISNLIRVATVVAGIWVLINFILAGYEYITSQGDTGAHNKVKDRVTMSIIGLVIIVSAYVIAALIGLIIFGDASYFLNPTIKGPTP